MIGLPVLRGLNLFLGPLHANCEHIKNKRRSGSTLKLAYSARVTGRNRVYCTRCRAGCGDVQQVLGHHAYFCALATTALSFNNSAGLTCGGGCGVQGTRVTARVYLGLGSPLVSQDGGDSSSGPCSVGSQKRLPYPVCSRTACTISAFVYWIVGSPRRQRSCSRSDSTS